MSWNKEQRSILAMVAVTSFMGTFLISAVNIALPAIGDDFGMDAVSLGWLITSFLLASAMFLLPLGRLGDARGIRKLFKTGVIFFTITSLLCAIAPSGKWLIVFRFLQGTGAALTSTTGPAILVLAFPAGQRGRVLGISIAAVYLGLATGPLLGGFLTMLAGWRSIFLSAAVIGILMIFGAVIVLKKDAPIPVPRYINMRGMWYYMPGLVLLVYGTSHIPNWSGWIMILAGIFMLLGFWMHEQGSNAPVFDTSLFTRNRLFAYSNIAALINYSATFAIVFFLSLYLQKIQQLSPREAGMVIMAQPVTMAVFSPLAGRLSDRFQVRYLATMGMTMCTIGLAALSFSGADTSIGYIVGVLVWVGLGFALFSSPNMSTIMGSVEPSQYGIASGTSATMRVLGQLVSMNIATIFFAIFFAAQTVAEVSPQKFLKAMSWGFICFSAISALGIYFSFHRGRVER